MHKSIWLECHKYEIYEYFILTNKWNVWNSKLWNLNKLKSKCRLHMLNVKSLIPYVCLNQ